ncbi:MAG: hypothetical protein EP343_03670 [Deltaproteobacteria bacterium]|nr:MAG: hypothetical protein EP343_03670 [Deltaproteobacteria bacterium]
MTQQDYEQLANRWKPLFWVAMGYNVVAAIGPLVMPKLFTTLFFATSPASLSVISLLHIQLAWICVFAFGVGYGIVALNPQYNRGILLLGILGKLYVGVLFSVFWWSGHLQVAAFLGGLGDIVFAALFFIYLYQTRSQAKVLRWILL